MSQLKTNWLLENRNVLFPFAPPVGEKSRTDAGQLPLAQPATMLTCVVRQLPSAIGWNGPTARRVLTFTSVTMVPLLSCTVHLAVIDLDGLNVPEYDPVFGGSAVAIGLKNPVKMYGGPQAV